MGKFLTGFPNDANSHASWPALEPKSSRPWTYVTMRRIWPRPCPFPPTFTRRAFCLDPYRNQDSTATSFRGFPRRVFLARCYRCSPRRCLRFFAVESAGMQRVCLSPCRDAGPSSSCTVSNGAKGAVCSRPGLRRIWRLPARVQTTRSAGPRPNADDRPSVICSALWLPPRSLCAR